MKTNQIITRKMGDFEVYQRTKDAYFDASSLLEQWNTAHPEKQKEMRKYLELKSTKEFLEQLKNSEKPAAKKGDTDNQELIPVIEIKGRKLKTGQTPNKYWLHPYVYLDMAMWINPKFKVEVIKFVYDQLISLRNQIGTEYKDFSAACATVGCTEPEEYQNLARCLNCAVLGANRQTKQRNELTELEAVELQKVQNIFIEAVNNGWVKNIQQAKQYFKTEYEKRFPKLPFDKK